MIVAALAGLEEAIIIIQDELYNLILEDHVHSDVLRLHLRPEQSRTKYNSHVLPSHAIVIPILNDPVIEDKKKRSSLFHSVETMFIIYVF